jgi:hypothetical protein
VATPPIMKQLVGIKGGAGWGHRVEVVVCPPCIHGLSSVLGLAFLSTVYPPCPPSHLVTRAPQYITPLALALLASWYPGSAHSQEVAPAARILNGCSIVTQNRNQCHQLG